MQIICSYCDRNLGEKEPLENKSLTHGICKECMPEFFRKSGFPENEIEAACIEVIEGKTEEREKDDGNEK